MRRYYSHQILVAYKSANLLYKTNIQKQNIKPLCILIYVFELQNIQSIINLWYLIIAYQNV